MMFTTVTDLAILYQNLPSEAAGVPGGGTGAFSVDWSSWSALMESVSGPLAMRLAAWLGGGCAVGICLSLFVRGRRGRALVGGTFGGLLAAGAFLMAAPPLGEMTGHLLAGGILGLVLALMIARTWARRRKPGGY